MAIWLLAARRGSARRTPSEGDAVARVDVVMPQMGESIAEGTLSKWLKKVGDAVKRDEPIFEISTDKVDAEIPAPSSGVLAEILVTEGQTVPVQTVVARLETEVGAAVARLQRPAPAKPAAGQRRPRRARPPQRLRQRLHRLPAAPQSAADGDRRHARHAGGNGASLEERLRTKSSPLVRKIAAEHGVEITAPAGQRHRRPRDQARPRAVPRIGRASRPGGAAVHARTGRRRTTHAPVPEPWPGDVVEPMSKMRALISDHMVVSRRHVGARHLVLRGRLHARRAHPRTRSAPSSRTQTGAEAHLPAVHHHSASSTGSSSIRCSTPRCAATSIIYRKQYNIGIAVALDWGLIVPVIKHADDLSLTGLTRSLNDLANRARAQAAQARAKCRTARSRSRTPASSVRSSARRSSTSRRSAILCTRRDREAPQGHHGRRRRGHDRHSHLRVSSRCRSTTASSTAPTPTSSWRS